MHRISPEETVLFEVSLRGPIKEYNPYFPEIDDLSYEIQEVESIDLMLDYCWEGENLSLVDSNAIDGALRIQGLASDDVIGRLTISRDIPRVMIMRRTDHFERL